MRLERGGFAVASRVCGGALTLTLVGEVDLAVAPELELMGRTLAAQLSVGEVVIDLGGVGFADVAGSAAVWRMREAFRVVGATVEISGAGPAVMRVFVLLGLPMSGGADFGDDDLPAGLSGISPSGLPRHFIPGAEDRHRGEH